ncbi:UDP-N-acetylglucosamine 2-epimerase (non-hydrolyzing) [Pedobacter cryoconitis]|uniref:UDP-N-acetylglucosamine 2-epimerase (non-hydrolyzing) n=1 Tax=Pedobacter cryoconitis TaxID=188932 RepID=A0A7W8ZM80_9SPHI|nr:UDP-N-acetylglucosamine 2-epimerase (non-hydrolyzing) [Pedobacter cryoconitis]MBB5636597.1 UDP-N-acetylglucosamine 2-epimerase (non-hydrolyzing) [Pedobacter cryoconitis]
MKNNILIVFGTRPEAIKMAPLVNALKKEALFNVKVCVTAQHREMLDQVLDFFSIIPDYDLNIMKANQTLHSLTAAVIEGLKPILDDFSPQYVFVHGDTTTTMAASLAGFYSGAEVCHVEAGLRTFNKYSPFPEEINRKITGVIANYHFAPTQIAQQNLLSEGVKAEDIIVTGNTVIDSLLESMLKVNSAYSNEEIEELKGTLSFEKDIVLVTGHRRENHGDGFLNICKALEMISKLDNVEIVYPVHLNPNVKDVVFEKLSNNENIKLIKPLSYPTFLWLMNKSKIILTDSGGIQEEAPSLGKPVLVMRDTTERPEAVSAGTVLLVGTETNKIFEESKRLLQDKKSYEEMSMLHNPYGDGHAVKRIVEFVLNRASKNSNG